MNKTFLIITDSYSKWLEVLPTSANSLDTIEKLRMVFATHGLPEQCVTDNGSPFTSMDFETFLQNNGIKHIRTSPYHAASNGMAERMVQTFKNTLKKMCTGTDFSEKLQKFLFTYRITPQTTTGKAPAELLMGRQLVSAHDLVRPNLGRRVREKQSNMFGGARRRLRELSVGMIVYVRNFGQGSLWWKGRIENMHGPLTWVVRLEDGRLIQRHADHIRPGYSISDDPKVVAEQTRVQPEVPSTASNQPIVLDEQGIPGAPRQGNVVSDQNVAPQISVCPESSVGSQTDVNIPTGDATTGNEIDGTETVRRSTRVRKPTDFYGISRVIAELKNLVWK